MAEGAVDIIFRLLWLGISSIRLTENFGWQKKVKKRGGSGKAEKAIRKLISTAPGIGYGHPFLEAPGETLLPLGPGQSQTRAKGRARAKRWTGNEGEEQARLGM